MCVYIVCDHFGVNVEDMRGWYVEVFGGIKVVVEVILMGVVGAWLSKVFSVLELMLSKDVEFCGGVFV